MWAMAAPRWFSSLFYFSYETSNRVLCSINLCSQQVLWLILHEYISQQRPTAANHNNNTHLRKNCRPTNRLGLERLHTSRFPSKLSANPSWACLVCLFISFYSLDSFDSYSSFSPQRFDYTFNWLFLIIIEAMVSLNTEWQMKKKEKKKRKIVIE